MSEQQQLARIESSAVLRRVRETLLNEVSFRADKSARLDPMLILMVISIVVQLVSFCKKRNNDARIANWIRNARTLPPRRTARLRSRLDALLDKECGAGSANGNPLYDAVLDLGENASDEEIEEILRLASETDAA